MKKSFIALCVAAAAASSWAAPGAPAHDHHAPGAATPSAGAPEQGPGPRAGKPPAPAPVPHERDGVTREEFLARAAQDFERMDANRDNKLSREEAQAFHGPRGPHGAGRPEGQGPEQAKGERKPRMHPAEAAPNAPGMPGAGAPAGPRPAPGPAR